MPSRPQPGTEGWSIRRVRDTDTFCRLVVTGDDELVVDLALDSPPSLPAAPSNAGPTFALEELAGRKLIALFDRAEARDFADVFALARGYDTDLLLRRAAEIDTGFSTTVFAIMLGSLSRFTDDEIPMALNKSLHSATFSNNGDCNCSPASVIPRAGPPANRVLGRWTLASSRAPCCGASSAPTASRKGSAPRYREVDRRVIRPARVEEPPLGPADHIDEVAMQGGSPHRGLVDARVGAARDAISHAAHSGGLRPDGF
ncbi:MAG: nucleotidyl transferase AbiEii/AbiGii toxin family protein [Actinomycetota bacterium]|nr:nucleotidyl transferase AbiEii/AbiGii toxin family protein [Actinomycetota bacterium]